MTNAKILGVSLALCAAFSMSAEAKLYKWVDDRGETHYGESIPPEYAEKDRVQLDEKGRVVKKKQAQDDNNSLEGKSADQKAAIEQRRKDKALLNTYSNEKEIDLARDRNLQQVEARIESVQLQIKSAQESLDGFHKEANSGKAQSANQKAGLAADTDAAEKRLARLKLELDAANQKAASVRAAFDADKLRYRELTGNPDK